MHSRSICIYACNIHMKFCYSEGEMAWQDGRYGGNNGNNGNNGTSSNNFRREILLIILTEEIYIMTHS